jgi:hypothetical protein
MIVYCLAVVLLLSYFAREPVASAQRVSFETTMEVGTLSGRDSALHLRAVMQ